MKTYKTSQFSGVDRNKGFIQFIKDNERVPFNWGNHNCILFVYHGLKAQGIDLGELPDHGDTLLSSYRAYMQWLSDQGVSSAEEYFDRHFERLSHVPTRGSIVCKAVGKERPTFGLVEGANGIFVGPKGLDRLRLNPSVDLFWKVE